MLNRIEVVNVRTAKPGTFEYCGRYNSTYGLQASPLANPFRLTREGCRNTIFVLYREWLHKQMRSRNKAVIAEITRLAIIVERAELTLGCWCAPKRCHCEVIADVVRKTCAARAARVAAYSSPTARTPSDYTLLEALQAMPPRDATEMPKKQARKAVSA